MRKDASFMQTFWIGSSMTYQARSFPILFFMAILIPTLAPAHVMINLTLPDGEVKQYSATATKSIPLKDAECTVKTSHPESASGTMEVATVGCLQSSDRALFVFSGICLSGETKYAAGYNAAQSSVKAFIVESNGKTQQYSFTFSCK